MYRPNYWFHRLSQKQAAAETENLQAALSATMFAEIESPEDGIARRSQQVASIPTSGAGAIRAIADSCKVDPPDEQKSSKGHTRGSVRWIGGVGGAAYLDDCA